MRLGSGGRPRYDGWYCDLLYNTQEESMHDVEDIRSLDWGPTIADVHTDPTSRSVLEAAVGDVNLGVIAIDNGGDRAVYVGPIFSYYEFRHPAEDRLTDERWQAMLVQDHVPAPPEWTTQDFQAPRRSGGRVIEPFAGLEHLVRLRSGQQALGRPQSSTVPSIARRRRLHPDLQPAPYRRSDRDDDQNVNIALMNPATSPLTRLLKLS